MSKQELIQALKEQRDDVKHFKPMLSDSEYACMVYAYNTVISLIEMYLVDLNSDGQPDNLNMINEVSHEKTRL